jgi:hypothetical protein
MTSNRTHKRLAFGPNAAASFANLEDYRRYRIACPGHLQWGYCWIKERMSLSGPVGAFQHSNTGFSFDTYLPIPQVNLFHNVMAIPGNFFSPYYMRVKSQRIEDFTAHNYYSDICCPLQLHVLSEGDLEYFINKAVGALKKNGNLILSFNLWLCCDAESKSILRESKVLRQNNKQVNQTLGVHYHRILKLSKELSLLDSINKEVMDEPEEVMEKILLEDERIVSQHSRTVFRRNYPEADQQYLQVADSVKSMAGCLWFKKRRAK